MRPPRPSPSSKCSSSSSYSLAATSLNSRLLTVFKKAQELTTLCDIEACVIHYGPDGELKTWPEDRDKVRDLALRYIQLDKAKRRKKSVNLYEFLNKMKDKNTMINNFKKKAKRNVEELKYPISDHYSPYQINQLIQSLELSYSKVQQRRRFLAAKKQNESLNPNQFKQLPQESGLKNHEVCVSAVQESGGSDYQLMPYGGYYDQNMICMGNNFQVPCVSRLLSVPTRVTRICEYFDQNMCMGDTTNCCNVLDPCLSDDFCFDFQDPYGANMVGNPSFPQDFNADMSSSYVYESNLLQESTQPSL